MEIKPIWLLEGVANHCFLCFLDVYVLFSCTTLFQANGRGSACTRGQDAEDSGVDKNSSVVWLRVTVLYNFGYTSLAYYFDVHESPIYSQWAIGARYE